MPVKLLTDKDNAIDVSALEDGQIAEIVRCDGNEEYIGLVVQRFGKFLITLGDVSGWSWDKFESGVSRELTGFNVRILQKGELIEIQ